ncbi:MAG: hypothetical protein L7T80_02830 [Arenicellales bacterium]|jgi:hypothetical protein|nr:hypothetical protein [Arenicellales bacterium]|tara:strand:- start:366 stop:1070 length:705 start_codon:yes stop_codon:yes gene_type:complete
MKYLGESFDLGAESQEESATSSAAFEAQLAAVQDRLNESKIELESPEWRELALQEGRLLVALERGPDAWQSGRSCFDRFCKARLWAEAIEAARIMFQSGETDALVALGHGVWLAVTFPVDPELSVALLQDIIEETPDDSDGAAVAAAVAAYVVELRSEGKEHKSLSFFTNQMLGAVARRHSGIEDQEAFDQWIERLELHDPARFLPRLRNVVDVLVQDNWWIDREAIQALLPVQ